jgi:hypothetical protein
VASATVRAAAAPSDHVCSSPLGRWTRRRMYLLRAWVVPDRSQLQIPTATRGDLPGIEVSGRLLHHGWMLLLMASGACRIIHTRRRSGRLGREQLLREACQTQTMGRCSKRTYRHLWGSRVCAAMPLKLLHQASAWMEVELVQAIELFSYVGFLPPLLKYL